MENNILIENLKETIKKAERYNIISLTSSIAFVILTLPNKVNDSFEPSGLMHQEASNIEWTLFGIPLSISPQLALIVFYILFVSSGFLASNLYIHISDLANKISNSEKVREILSYPTVLTVSPLGRFVCTILPSAFIIVGLIKINIQKTYDIHWIVWIFAYGFSLTGIKIYSQLKKYVVPNLFPERNREK